MGKVFVNRNRQGPAPPAHVFRSADAGEQIANWLVAVFLAASACGVCLLLYHYWKATLAILLAMVIASCWSSRGHANRLPVRSSGRAVVSIWAQTVVDGDTIQARRHHLPDLGHRCRGDEAGLCGWLDRGREGGGPPCSGWCGTSGDL
jgi:hypothetical protein